VSENNSDSIQSMSLILQQRIINGELDLPLLPKVAGSVVAMTQDEDSDMQGLANLIQGDQALASRVMKIANSPAYRGVNPMSSLQQAIARLGMQSIAEIALAASVGTKVFCVEGFQHEVKYLWKHSLACGHWAKEIARTVRRNVESGFMCGLLHQIGKPVALQALTDIKQQRGYQISNNAILGLVDEFYISVGSTLGASWELPATVLEAIKYHQNYTQAQQYSHDVMGATGAHFLSDEMLGENGLTMECALTNDCLADLNLYESDIERLVSQQEKILDVVEAMAL